MGNWHSTVLLLPCWEWKEPLEVIYVFFLNKYFEIHFLACFVDFLCWTLTTQVEMTWRLLLTRWIFFLCFPRYLFFFFTLLFQLCRDGVHGNQLVSGKALPTTTCACPKFQRTCDHHMHTFSLLWYHHNLNIFWVVKAKVMIK